MLNDSGRQEFQKLDTVLRYLAYPASEKQQYV